MASQCSSSGVDKLKVYYAIHAVLLAEIELEIVKLTAVDICTKKYEVLLAEEIVLNQQCKDAQLKYTEDLISNPRADEYASIQALVDEHSALLTAVAKAIISGSCTQKQLDDVDALQTVIANKKKQEHAAVELKHYSYTSQYFILSRLKEQHDLVLTRLILSKNIQEQANYMISHATVTVRIAYNALFVAYKGANSS
jgi:hypothetical protein